MLHYKCISRDLVNNCQIEELIALVRKQGGVYGGKTPTITDENLETLIQDGYDTIEKGTIKIRTVKAIGLITCASAIYYSPKSKYIHIHHVASGVLEKEDILRALNKMGFREANANLYVVFAIPGKYDMGYGESLQLLCSMGIPQNNILCISELSKAISGISFGVNSYGQIGV